MAKIKHQNLIQQAGFGLTSAGIIGAYALCTCASLNRGAIFALVCAVLCSIFSLKCSNNVLAPSPLLIPALFIFAHSTSPLCAFISVPLGGIVYLVLKKILNSKVVPGYISVGLTIGLALSATILLTNTYFGIGAHGTTPVEMLKSYRSLGFHPDFRGLLYGTITLFTMITYPFKFRKLNKYLPAEFITIFIPFILNILLNTNPEYTTTNEYSFAYSRFEPIYNSIDLSDFKITITTGLALGFLLFVVSKSQGTVTGIANAVNGFLTATPVTEYSVRGYSPLSAVVVILILCIVFLLCPGAISRFPLPCAGSMLIVSAWQNVPFTCLSATMKKQSIFRLLVIILCATSFVVTNIFTAALFCACMWVLGEKISPEKEVLK